MRQCNISQAPNDVGNVAWLLGKNLKSHQNRRASRRLSLAALAGAAFAATPLPALAQEAEERRQEDETEQHGEIVVLGTRTARDATLSSDLVTERMS